jgi:hypothetical protein
VVEGFAAAARSVDCDLNIFFNAPLPDVFVEALGADTDIDARVLVEGRARDNSLRLSLLHHAFCGAIRH